MAPVQKVVGSVLGGITGTAKAPDIIAPEPATPAPTIDQGRAVAEAEVAKDKRKGRLANYLTPSNTSAQLGGAGQTAGNFIKTQLGA